MTLKHYLILILSIYINIAKAQDLKISIRATGNNAYLSSIYFPENNITICLTKSGNIIDAYRGSMNNADDLINDSEETDDENSQTNKNEIDQNLDVTYYGSSDWDELRGKIKSIGDLPVTYYDRFGWEETKGKIKSIGNTNFSYYDRFDWEKTKGKLKSVGNFNITYYDRFGWDELKGKMKTIGNTTFTYYDRFDLEAKRGRLKSISGNTVNLYVLRPKTRFSDF